MKGRPRRCLRYPGKHSPPRTQQVLRPTLPPLLPTSAERRQTGGELQAAGLLHLLSCVLTDDSAKGSVLPSTSGTTHPLTPSPGPTPPSHVHPQTCSIKACCEWTRPMTGFTLKFSWTSMCSIMSSSLQPHGLQHARPSCPSPTPRVHSNSCPSSW